MNYEDNLIITNYNPETYNIVYYYGERKKNYSDNNLYN